MAKEFDENKHPRAKDGKFTSKDSGAVEYRQNTRYDEIVRTEKGGIDLSSKEWAQFYTRLGEIKRGGYVDTTSNGEKLLIIENKIIITSGSYEEPKALSVFQFENEDEYFVLMEILK